MCCRYAIVNNKAENQFSFFRLHCVKAPVRYFKNVCFYFGKWFQAMFALKNGIHESIR